MFGRILTLIRSAPIFSFFIFLVPQFCFCLLKNRQEARVKCKRNRIKCLKAAFQRLAYQDKENYYNNHCIEIEQ